MNEEPVILPRKCLRITPTFRFRKRSTLHHSSQPHAAQWHRRKARTCLEGPFGEVLRMTGDMANANPFRFSTKYQDDETDLLYYGYRYYNASTGRWLSRDPIGERGGLNLFTFVWNDPIGRLDNLGLSPIAALGPLNVGVLNGPQHVSSGLIPAAMLSFIDQWILPVVHTEESSFFTENGDDRFAAATEKSKKWFSSVVAKKVCGLRDGYNIPPFKAKPASDPAEPGNYPVEMSDWERSFVIGSFDYNLTRLITKKRGEYGNLISWSAEVTITDHLGWDGEKYPLFPSRMNKAIQTVVGKPGRPFSRGVFWLSGEVDCCELAARLHN